jgi:hypothetical protein
MPEERTGMTTKQKIFTFVPLAAVCAYAILSIFGLKIHLGTRGTNAVPSNIYVYTSGSDCGALPSSDEEERKSVVNFTSLDGGQYTINFTGNNPFEGNPTPMTGSTSYTIKRDAAYTAYPYTITGSNCKTQSAIGIIVTH